MSNWFDKWIATKAQNILIRQKRAQEQEQYKIKEEKYALISPGQAVNITGIAKGYSNRELETNPDLNFRMYRAENGYAMEVRQYDKRTDRHTINLHLILDDQDLGQSIAQIITVESLKVL